MDVRPNPLEGIKYWHDKTVQTSGWKRVLPLIGLLTTVVVMVVKHLYQFTMNRFRLICERQQEEAAERAYRAATDPDYKAVEFTWLTRMLTNILEAIGTRIVPEEFRRLPSLEHYLKLNPGCKTTRGIKCCHCNSGSIRNFGLESRDDEYRLFICNHCNAKLYRTALPDDVKITNV